MDFSKYIQFYPEYEDAYWYRGNINLALKKYKEAINDFNKYMEWDPYDGETNYLRGNAKYYAGDKTSACLDWKKASELGFEKADEALTKYCK